MKKCAVTGTFDPLTFGHIELVDKACDFFNEIVVLMLVNPEKKAVYSVEKRLEVLKEYFKDYKKVSVDFYDGYAVDYCKKHNIECLIRGVRNGVDYEYEKFMAEENFKLGQIPTMFFYSDSKEISSTKAREKLQNMLSAKEYLPESVEKILRTKE